MDYVRYIIAVVSLISIPPAFLLWFAIHPFAGFWRKFGAGWTYAILTIPVLVLMAGVFFIRRNLLAAEYGTNLPLIVLAIFCIACGTWIAMKRKKYLTFGILAGLPELSQKRYPGKLLKEGIYSKIRHPRYVEAFLWIWGYAFFANYFTVYVMAVLCLPAIFLVVVLEEKELRQRFGQKYEAYCQQVPRFVPRFASNK
ncbi:MAG: methyltransferase [bacterium]